MILAVAAAFRFYGLAWDGGYLFHPDERKILLVASELRLPSNAFEFFSTDSPLNPKFFAYGSFPIYLLKILGAFAPTPALVVPWREDFVRLALLGRALSALFDLGTIALTFLLARRLYDAATGLIAAACIAVTVLHIQLSHFYAVDTLLTLLVVATMYFAARL
ncbi:MAG: glycosyltransferase family 39 protein, partial [Chloroflexota bacterium]